MAFSDREKTDIQRMLKLNDLIGGYEDGKDSLFMQYIEINNEADLGIKMRMAEKGLMRRNHRKNSH